MALQEISETALKDFRDLFDDQFIAAWAGNPQPIEDDDQKAAASLHLQLISRIATQVLGFGNGVEKTALKSIYDLFDHTRAICLKHLDARCFSALAWYVLNTHVRPFTAKWHRLNEQGMLEALDTTDLFRGELETLQTQLRLFERLLARMCCSLVPDTREESQTSRKEKIRKELEQVTRWEIPKKQGGIKELDATEINAAEKKAVESRRRHYQAGVNTDPTQATGLALSGGGIRSATFSLGVLVALAKRGLLPQFDYLSTVSGGGYLGSFITAYLNPPAGTFGGQAVYGLRSDELPFQREAGEAEALRHIRHHSKYLASGPLIDRLGMVAAQLYGMGLNAIAVVLLAYFAAMVEYFLRQVPVPLGTSGVLCRLLGLWVAFCVIRALFLLRWGERTSEKAADFWVVKSTASLLLVLAWHGLAVSHAYVIEVVKWHASSSTILVATLGAIPASASMFASVFGKTFDRIKQVLGWLSIFSAPLFVFVAYLIAYHVLSTCTVVAAQMQVISIPLAAGVCYYLVLNVNVTSPHRHYRNKLSDAYLIRTRTTGPDEVFESADNLKLSEVGKDTQRTPYHLLNAALNVPTSQNSAMQGRFTDFFLFSPAFCGSPLTGYKPTQDWEAADSHLNLATAMAISGAAAAPQMGLGTKRPMSFWLALLNIRLGYWLRNPSTPLTKFEQLAPGPGILYLFKEMFGKIDEKKPWLYLSDGGHIENLGVYELLRRRCKFIVAIDGEQDERMTFGALTNLQRLASIDLGIKIDVNLDDLRTNPQGLSRSHFRFCRIEYPGNQYGYLLYAKLSLTGNEGEFLRRYRLDEPAFPHTPTANQSFSESQFEAYRSLGEHIGDKFFMKTLVGDLSKPGDINLEEWFQELAVRLLEPLPTS